MKKAILLFVLIVLAFGVSAQVKFKNEDYEIERLAKVILAKMKETDPSQASTTTLEKIKEELKADELFSTVMLWDSLQLHRNIEFVPTPLKQEDSVFYQKYEQAHKEFQKQLAQKVLTKDVLGTITDYIKVNSEKKYVCVFATMGFDSTGKIRYMLISLDKELAGLLPDIQWISLYNNILKEDVPLTNYFDFRSGNDCAETIVNFSSLIKNGEITLSDLEDNLKATQNEPSFFIISIGRHRDDKFLCPSKKSYVHGGNHVCGRIRR